MNKFAEIYGGRIRDIKETELNYVDFVSLFSPKSYWIDVTGVACEIGYVQEFKEGQGIVFVDPALLVIAEATAAETIIATDTPEVAFQKTKAKRLKEFGAEFAKRRDAITWALQSDGMVYGYDRTIEDIPNFLANMERARNGNATFHKVYINNVDTKELRYHTLKMFQDVLEQSSQEQITAYTRYEAIKKQILEECATFDELNAITW